MACSVHPKMSELKSEAPILQQNFELRNAWEQQKCVSTLGTCVEVASTGPVHWASHALAKQRCLQLAFSNKAPEKLKF